MPVSYSCPKCQTIVSAPTALPAGKKIECPKCSARFPIPAAKSEASAKKPAAAAAKPAPPKRAAAKKSTDDDDEGGAYGFKSTPAEEAEEEENKPLYGEAPPPPRNIVREVEVTVIGPAKKLLVMGMLLCGGAIVWMLILIFPLVFNDHLLNPVDYIVDEKKKPLDVEWKELTKEQIRTLRPIEQRARLERWAWVAGSVIVLLLGSLISMGAVKMLYLESFSWAVASSILSIVSVIPLIVGAFWTLYSIGVTVVIGATSPLWAYVWIGVVCLTTLFQKDVQEGFQAARKKFRTRKVTDYKALASALVGTIAVAFVMIAILIVLSHRVNDEDVEDTSGKTKAAK